MSGRFPPLDRVQVEAILNKAGFEFERQSGSHAHWVGFIKNQRRVVTVDHLKKGQKEKYGHPLLKSMIKQSGLSKKEFYACLNK